MVTSWTLTIWYRLITRAGEPIPARGTPRYNITFRRIFICVVSLYLLYTIYEAYHILTQQPTFYDLLSLPHDVDPRTLKSRFRRLTIQYHPDKVGAQGAEHFVTLKQAYDVLLDPVQRFAYDRFGADILDWEHCHSTRDYIFRGALALAPYYGGTLVFLVILSVLGKFETGRYWRFLALTLLLVFEGTMMTRPYAVITTLPFTKPLLAFEHAVLARKIVLTSFIALGQLGPSLMKQETLVGDGKEALERKLVQLDVLSRFMEAEAAKAQRTEFLPFEGDPEGEKEVQRKMGDWLVEMQIRDDPEVRDAMGNVLRRKRQGVPAGAKGTK
jgi:hypothetical protein